jgi:hypothetical protein
MRFAFLFSFLLCSLAFAADSTGSAVVKATIEPSPTVNVNVTFPAHRFFTSANISAKPPAGLPIDSITTSVLVDGKLLVAGKLANTKGTYAASVSNIPAPSEATFSVKVYSGGRLKYQGSTIVQLKDKKPVTPAIQLSEVP